MPDREKVEHVINVFERVIEVFDGRISGPYFEAWMCATKDALALLKAQEAVKSEMSDADFMSHIIIEICDFAVKNEMEPNDTLRTIADNIKALLNISTFNNWKPNGR